MRYAIVVERATHNFSAYVPDLPGCVAAGRTREKALELIREAIGLHILGLRKRGERVPKPVSTTEYVEV